MSDDVLFELTDQEMVDYTNALLDRNMELKEKVERLEKELGERDDKRTE